MNNTSTSDLAEPVIWIAKHCGSRDTYWRKTPKGPVHVKESLKRSHIERHVDSGPGIGLAPIKPGTSTTRILVIDGDSHKGEVTWPKMRAVGAALAAELTLRGLRPIPFRSSGGRGWHIICVWEGEQDAYSVRELARQAAEACDLAPGTKGVAQGQVEIFPKSDSTPADGFGAMFVLPMTGESIPLDPKTLADRDYLYAESAVAGGDWKHSDPVPVLERPKIERPALPKLDAQLADIKAMLDAIPNDGGVDSPEYDLWRDIVFAVHDATGGSDEGLALVHDFSSRNPTKYDPTFLDARVWPHIRSDRTGPVKTLRSLAYEARKHGYIEDVSGDFESLPALEAPAQPAGAPSTLRTANNIDTATLLQSDYLIKGWLDRGSNAVLFGEWNAGKTFVALSMGVHIAAGLPLFNCRVRQAGVLYLPFEGARGLDKRVAALRAQHPSIDWRGLPFAWRVLRYPLTTKEGREELQAAIKDFHARFGGAPGLVIIDPLKDALGGDDSDAELMGKLNTVVLGLIAAHGCAVLRLHHSGHTDKTRGRGHSSLPAAADTEIMVTDGTISSTKQRDNDKSELAFKRIVVELGADQDGDTVTTCIIEYLDAKLASKRREPKGPTQRLVWQLAHELMELGGEGVGLDALITAAKDRLPFDPAKRDNRRRDALRALNGLRDERFLVIEDDLVKVPGGK